MFDRTDIVYYYDGTFDGLLCCIFASYAKKEIPLDIIDQNGGQLQLFAGKQILTEKEKARRVACGLRDKAGKQAYAMLQRGFLTCLPQKEITLLRFARVAFAQGRGILRMLSHPAVLPLANALTHLRREAELLTGFVRFTEYEGVLGSVITPKNQVLPVLARHFCDRYNAEAFFIYDKTHRQVLLHYGQRSEIRDAAAMEVPDISAEEQCLQSLWRQFYDTIAIKERYNPRCQRTHMPLRYRDNMTEFQTVVQKMPPGNGALQKRAIQQKRYGKPLQTENRSHITEGDSISGNGLYDL